MAFMVRIIDNWKLEIILKDSLMKKLIISLFVVYKGIGDADNKLMKSKIYDLLF